MTREIFRNTLLKYCHGAGYTFKHLAAEIALSPVTLSRKLTGDKILTNLEVKQILAVLVAWGALNSRAEVLELLELAGLNATAYTPTEWASPPFDRLEIAPSAVSLAAFEELRPGQLLSNTYRLESFIGKGGVGQVWRATHLLLHELRAIKFIAANNDARTIKRFIQSEAKSLLQLQHHNIVRVYDLGQTQQCLYIVMEYVANGESGSDLKAWLKAKGRLEVATTATILGQVAAGLQTAHEAGLIHRDIKPANILISSGEGQFASQALQVKLADFGLAKQFAEGVELASDGLSPGTPLYMAPEQASGYSETRSDIYSLGVTLYELVTGQPPFSGSVQELRRQHASANPVSPTEINPLIPLAVSKVILKAMAKTPEARYASPLELAQAFSQAAGVPAFCDNATVAIKTTNLPINSTAKNLTPILPVKSNLPAQPNLFIGRKKELAALGELVSQPATRLITLTGPGGTGKTRLALALANELADNFRDGVYFVPLATLKDGQMLAEQIAHALNITEAENQKALASLKKWLRDKQLLMLLDNFEQLVEASGLVSDLLASLPQLKIIVTSRILLRVYGEQEFRVAPLALPDNLNSQLAAIGETEAVQLFVERAKAAKADFSLTHENISAVVEICRLLDGLPLALELAATRLKLFNPAASVKKLKEARLKFLTGGAQNLPAHQQTLYKTIEWSYNLLSAPEQLIYQVAGVFTGSCSLEGLAAVAKTVAELPPEVDLLEVVSSLVNKSMLKSVDSVRQEDEPRFFMIETLREYALEQLAAHNWLDQANRGHALYCQKLLVEMLPLLDTAEHAEGLRRVEIERTNLLAAVDWAIEQGDTGLKK